jgi:hypothetical protein
VRIWKQTVRWKKAHQAKGQFKAVEAGEVETLRIPVFIHPCEVCDGEAPFGIKNLWYCREHLP